MCLVYVNEDIIFSKHNSTRQGHRGSADTALPDWSDSKLAKGHFLQQKIDGHLLKLAWIAETWTHRDRIHPNRQLTNEVIFRCMWFVKKDH